MIRNKINPDVHELNKLNQKYSWIPNENTIRPSQLVLENKKRFNAEILEKWPSIAEYIFSKYFDLKIEWILERSLFPYDLPPNVNHDILWNCSYNYFTEFSDDLINAVISNILESKTGNNGFDFAWYKNPKPSVPDFWHVQVFWIIQ